MEKKWVEEIKREFGVIAESLRDEIKLVAEGHDILRHSIETLREEMNAGFNEDKIFQKWVKDEFNWIRNEFSGIKNEFNEVKSMIKLSYAELEHRITTLEKAYKDIERRVASLETNR